MTRRIPPPRRVLPAALVLLVVLSPAPVMTSWAQGSVESVAPAAPIPPTPPEVRDRQQEEELLRSLFELHMKIGRTTDPAERDSLQAAYEVLVRRVNERIPRGSESKRVRELRIERTEELIDELERQFQDSDIDWEEVSKSLDEGVQGLGVGLEQLGELLQDVQIRVEGEEFEFRDGRGSRISVPLKLPPEVRDSVAEGLRDFMDALEDSNGRNLLSEIRKIVPPDAVGQWGRWEPRGERKRHVVAQSVFRFHEEFDLAEDEIVQGDVIIIGADCTVAGEVQGNAYVLLGNLVVEDSGTVGKDAVSVGGEVVLEGSSSVRGKMFDISSVAPGFLAGPWSGLGSGMAIPMHGIRVAVLALLLFIGFAVAGDRFQAMGRYVASFPLRNLLWGSLYLLVAMGGFALISVGLAITVIGIPVAIVIAVAFVGLLLGAYFIACQVLGARLLAMVGGEKPHAAWIAGLLGLAILEIPAFLGASMPPAGGASVVMPLQLLDYVLKFIALSIGVGSIVATRFGVQPSDAVKVSAVTVEEAHNPT